MFLEDPADKLTNSRSERIAARRQLFSRENKNSRNQDLRNESRRDKDPRNANPRDTDRNLAIPAPIIRHPDALGRRHEEEEAIRFVLTIIENDQVPIYQ